MGGGAGRLRGFWRVLYALTSSLVFFWFLTEEILPTSGTSITTTGTTIGSYEYSKFRGRDAPSHPDLDLNYMSKRRVPNGPDPIHNRRAGKSRQPPGRAK
ncbi:hypothetical protein H6P81_010280 [Aristolochia fimbriata]|uniref:CLAVATA3/ESR (CLE)-related protein 25 n=1 Tax=Aristolochia fimbriata TaxID=158543 RepID=A0AAV7ENB1_ARIFI|nr:hypothetical protein H6P81_010280 [Aristolochia fimbriata]